MGLFRNTAVTMHICVKTKIVKAFFQGSFAKETYFCRVCLQGPLVKEPYFGRALWQSYFAKEPYFCMAIFVYGTVL